MALIINIVVLLLNIPSEYVSEYSDNEIVLTVKRRNGEEFIINMGITLKESMG